MLTASSCANRVITVRPDPASFGRAYNFDLASAGREIAAAHCIACHAVDQGGANRASRAPALNTLLSRLDPDDLADSLVAGLDPSHHRMPAFDFNVIAADALVAYLETLPPPAAGAR
jgi:mono/diheme cytochrome c family protein